MAKRQSQTSLYLEEPEYVYQTKPKICEVNKGEYKGLKGNTDIANKMNKVNINKYLKAFVMQNLEDGNVQLSREYRNRSTDNGYIK